MKNNTQERNYFIKIWFWIVIIMIIVAWMIFAINNDRKTNKTSSRYDNILNNSQNDTENILETEKKEVVLIDFSTMSKEDIQNWCSNSNINCNIKNQYSDTISTGSFISQSPQANTKIYEGDTVILIYSLGKEPTLGERNALATANDYLNYTAFSYTGLIEQLEFEGFSKEEATYGADHCEANWNEQAAKSAQQYMKYSSFSKSGLIDQLEFEGFTREQAEYGATAVGY
mgnify:FL=1